MHILSNSSYPFIISNKIRTEKEECGFSIWASCIKIRRIKKTGQKSKTIKKKDGVRYGNKNVKIRYGKMGI